MNVTLRIFLVPDALARNRRQRIEMDKVPRFVDRAGQDGARRGGLSSLVQKPVSRPPSGRRDPNRGRRRCRCLGGGNCTRGWPFPLLLPRGNQAELPSQLLSWPPTPIETRSFRIGSEGLSYCDAKDVDYPDAREMSYPFDRRFSLGAVPAERAPGALGNVTIRSLTIRHLPG